MQMFPDVKDGRVFINLPYARVGNSFDPSNFNPSTFTTCAHYGGTMNPSNNYTLNCSSPTRGRYVSIDSDKEMLLCEVYVFSDYGEYGVLL